METTALRRRHRLLRRLSAAASPGDGEPLYQLDLARVVDRVARNAEHQVEALRIR